MHTLSQSKATVASIAPMERSHVHPFKKVTSVAVDQPTCLLADILNEGSEIVAREDFSVLMLLDNSVT